MSKIMALGVAACFVAIVALFAGNTIVGEFFDEYLWTTILLAVSVISLVALLFSKSSDEADSSHNEKSTTGLAKQNTTILKATGNKDVHRYDSSLTRSRRLRWLVFSLSLGLCFAVPMWLCHVLALQFSEALGVPALFAGALVGIELFVRILPYYIVDVPQVQGFVTINNLVPTFNFGGVVDVIYGPGIHISFPWEGRSEKSNFSLEVFTLQWNEDVPGADTQLLATGSYQFEVDLNRADRFIGIDPATIETGALDIIKAEVSRLLATKSGNDAKREIDEINDSLKERFGLKQGSSIEDVERFEKRYGIRSKAITIAGIDLPELVQKTRDAVDEAQQVINGVAAMYGMESGTLKDKLANGNIALESYNEMLDRFAAKSGNATMDIKAYKLHGLGDLGQLLNNFKGGK
jgi:uncharacterized membrane protein